MEREHGRLSRCLRRLVANLSAAAAGLCHLTAFAVHDAATGALRVTHCLVTQAGHNGRSREEQKQNRDESGQTPHSTSISAQNSIDSLDGAIAL